MSVNNSKYNLNTSGRNAVFPFIIAFEGIDGCGKTTVSKIVAKSVNALYVHTPLDEFKMMKPVFENDANMIVPRFFYYLSGLWASFNYAVDNAVNGIVVFDRYILSTKLYHEALAEMNGIDFNIPRLPHAIFPAEPDVNIVLSAGEKEVCRRINCRQYVFDLKLEKNRKFQSLVNSKFLASDSVIIESAGNPDETAEKCLDFIRQSFFNADYSKRRIK